MALVTLGVFLIAIFLGISYHTFPALAVRFNQPSACVPGPHSGEITVDQTWCAVDNPHILQNDVSVAAGVTLTIEPGAIVKGDIYSGMTVLGRMEAVGTFDQPILFTSVR